MATRWASVVLGGTCALGCGRIGYLEQADEGDAARTDAVVPPVVTGNRIVQPGCENGLEAWQVIEGENWRCGSEIPAHEGELHFFPANAGTPELRQDLDLSDFASAIDQGTQAFAFEGFLGGFGDPDTTRIILEYIASDSTTVLDSWDTGEHDQDKSWLRVFDERTPPPGSRVARIRLLCRRESGSDCDGYWDALSFVGVGL